jgi:hypothetical protein
MTIGLKALRLFGGVGVALALSFVGGCGAVQVAAEPQLPAALITQLPLTVGVYYGDQFRTYVHKEERWGAEYQVTLGPGHVHLVDRLFKLEFKSTVPVESLIALPKDPPFVAILEPRIERFSFLTSRDTDGQYFAVTIDYRLNVFNAKGERIDSLTFVGYGSSSAGGMSSQSPLLAATRAAMRDAAAKFLVQFPEQATVKKLVAGETVAPLAGAAVAGAGEAGTEIEVVPIEEKKSEPAPDKQQGGV